MTRSLDPQIPCKDVKWHEIMKLLPKITNIQILTFQRILFESDPLPLSGFYKTSNNTSDCLISSDEIAEFERVKDLYVIDMGKEVRGDDISLQYSMQKVCPFCSCVVRDPVVLLPCSCCVACKLCTECFLKAGTQGPPCTCPVCRAPLSGFSELATEIIDKIDMRRNIELTNDLGRSIAVIKDILEKMPQNNEIKETLEKISQEWALLHTSLNLIAENRCPSKEAMIMILERSVRYLQNITNFITFQK